MIVTTWFAQNCKRDVGWKVGSEFKQFRRMFHGVLLSNIDKDPSYSFLF